MTSTAHSRSLRLAQLARRVCTRPPRETLSRTAARLAAARQRWRDRRSPTWSAPDAGPALELASYYRLAPAALHGESLEPLRAVAQRHLQHRFDLLGSGWSDASHGAECAGLEGHRFAAGAPVQADAGGDWLRGRVPEPCLPQAREAWRLVGARHRPIDWQLDLRSGHRWDARTWYRDVPIPGPAGADIKIPWELGRQQHLVLLAQAHALARSGAPGFAPAERYAAEFRDTVMDFIAANPPRFGAQWACAMDVALRVCSWLVARDLFAAGGAVFSGPWTRRFARSVREHALHLAANLEHGSVRANHYLADLVGLLFAAAYLPDSAQTRAWLHFAAGELAREIELQFHPDGSGFEASTSYHRLSAEMALHAAALLAALPAARHQVLAVALPAELRALSPAHPPGVAGARGAVFPWPARIWERLHAAGRFAREIAHPDGRTPLIGDCDSGRFLKLAVSWERNDGERKGGERGGGDASDWSETSDDHRHLGVLADAVAGRRAAEPEIAQASIETASLPRPRGAYGAAGSPPSDAPGADPATPGSYPGFGLFLLRRGSDHCTVRCGPNGQAGRGGHAHNDQLSFTLALDRCTLIADPGTYVYTPLPAYRQRLRSTAAHSTLQIGEREQNPLAGGDSLFALPDRACARAGHWDGRSFVGSHRGFGVLHVRELELRATGLFGRDRLDSPAPFSVRFALAPAVRVRRREASSAELEVDGRRFRLRAGSGALAIEDAVHCSGYGRRQPACALVVRACGVELAWSIERAQ